jgi:hypothetical protein
MKVEILLMETRHCFHSIILKGNFMSRKFFSTFLLTIIFLTILSFISGIFYERWQEAKNTLDIDHSLVVLLARSSDFEIPDGKWVNMGSYQGYYDPAYTSIDDYKVTGNSFLAYFPATKTQLGISHDISRYVPDKIPKTTRIDDYYYGAKSTAGLDIHWLNLKELDKKSRAFCTSSKSSEVIHCYVGSNYGEIVSTFAIWADNMEEVEIIKFLMPAIQKFYDRLSKSSIKY